MHAPYLTFRRYREFAEKLPASDLARVKAAFAEFGELDSRGMAFRYPEGLDGEKNLGPLHSEDFRRADFLRQISCVERM